MKNFIAGAALTLATKILDGLNPEQTDVVTHNAGPLLVAAVAGSGKTNALVKRIAHLVGVRGVDPSRILAVTFSRKGSDEMNERLQKLIGKNNPTRVGTFHSLAYEIVRREIKEKENFKVDDKNIYRLCIKEAVGFRELDWKSADVTKIERYIALCKCEMTRPYTPIAEKIAYDNFSELSSTMLQAAYEKTDEIANEKGILTFDEMLFSAVELLSKKENIRRRWAAKWDYVLQDEAQDQNLCQLLMGELLAKDHKNYMLVGDSAQTIFTWRGAKPEKLLGFEKAWNAKTIMMGRNYRCPQTVINAANKSLNAMDPATRLDLEMICEKKTQGEITVNEYYNQDDEGLGIAGRIKSLIEDNVKPRDIFVLYRTNAQSRGVEEALLQERIPYQIIGGTNFYERKEVKDLLSYLRIAEGRGDIEDVQRSINTPFRFLGKAFVTKVKETTQRARNGKKTRVKFPNVIRLVLRKEKVQRRQTIAAENWANMIDEISERIAHPSQDEENPDSPAKILAEIVRDTRFLNYLQKNEGEESTENSRQSNVRELIRAATKFNTVKELLDFIEKTINASRRQRKQRKSNPNLVTLTTCHRAKGMERPHVFIIGVNNGILPHARAENIEEERRIFYVGITRAEKTLHISCVCEAAMSNKVITLSPSVFLQESGLIDLMESETDRPRVTSMAQITP